MATAIGEPSDVFAALLGPAKKERASAPEGADRFLTLLVTQLKNQDPLNPLANAELTSQLAQINTVQGIEKLNATLGALSGDFQATRDLQAAALVGRQVLVPGASLALGAEGARAGFRLEQPVDNLTVSVTGPSGAVIHSVALGALPAGVHFFEWDGMADSGARAAPGEYGFAASGLAAGKKVEAAPLAFGRVDGVTLGKTGALVNLGALGERPLADIQRIM